MCSGRPRWRWPSARRRSGEVGLAAGRPRTRQERFPPTSRKPQTMPIETIVTPDVITRYTQAGFWGSRIWTDYIDETARQAPESIAIMDSAGSLTYAEFRRAIDHLALQLVELGIKKEERFGIQLPNWREFVIIRFALAKIGAVSVPLPADWRRKEVEYVLGTSEAVGLVVPLQFRGRDYVSEYAELGASVP